MKNLLLLFLITLTATNISGQNKSFIEKQRVHRADESSRKTLRTDPDHPRYFSTNALHMPRSLDFLQVTHVLDSLIGYWWDDQKSLWDEDYIAYYEFNEDAKIIAFSDLEWDAATGDLLPDDRETYEYNDKGNLILYTYFEQDKSGNWFSSWKRIYAYDDNSRLTHYEESQKDAPEESFYPVWRTMFYYDDMNRITGTREYIHLLAWKETWRTEYSYDDRGNLQSITDYNDGEEEDSWVYEWKQDYFYNDNNRLIEWYEYEWDEEKGDWVNSDKEEYIFSSNGNVEKFIDYNWNETEGEWIYSLKQEFSYDNNYSYEVLALPWFFHDDMPNFFNHMMTGYLSYDYIDGDWYNYYRNDYYFSDAGSLNVQEGLSENQNIFYPNPAENEIKIHLEGNYKTVHLDIFDISGRKVMNENIGVKQTIKIETLKRGIYFFQLKDAYENIVTKQKIYIK